jgi:hypothetical protein
MAAYAFTGTQRSPTRSWPHQLARLAGAAFGSGVRRTAVLTLVAIGEIPRVVERWKQKRPPSTFVLFRKEFDLSSAPTAARGWIAADSRYKLSVNGKRV